MNQLLKFINNLNASQRAVIIGGFSILFVLLIGLLVWSNIKAQDEKLNYTIAANLTKNQVMLASSELEASGIPFQVIGSGNTLTLRTSKEFINIAKIKLVTSEAATNKHTGWEIFEKSSLGTTNFENKVKYLRALEGELSRSLESLSGVLRASVKIAIPKDTIFTERKTLPTASAVLTIKPGIYLTQKQIDGIKNFIASAVSNLTAENIKLIDQDGSLLEHSKDEMDHTKVRMQNKYKEELEKDYEHKIIALLEPIVGMGKVVARVSVDLAFIKKDVREEIYDPEGTIRSQQTTENIANSQGVVQQNGGVPGVQSNIEVNTDGNAGQNSTQSSSEETKNIINYEISKRIVNEEDNAFASLKRITAAVTFDSTVLAEVENKDEYVSSIVSVVQDTIGFSETRGDQITVKDFKFLSSGVSTSGAQVDANGNVIAEEGGSVDTLAMVKTILQEFSEYIQYIIATLLLFIFYKKFIAKNDIVIYDEKGNKVDADGNIIDDDGQIIKDYENEFDRQTAHGRLKAKVRSQLLNNIEGLDEEDAAKYEVLIDEIDKQVNDKPEEIAGMIEMLLTEGDAKFKLREAAKQNKA
ncbi:flagellar basal-body MS-ring/collar protein FliF [Candidatus Marinarcus aquaticus]|uniref:Flagellar M-ring protein n=1 Tax=Candidatus Marinarcus aquaticus TaxID=2044504 RepID=A0A4Q0XNU0_9BACT|nr:flagellar basal-body MS-ring/collar protein FliF [Candidatus Marinarcus aquaticus]RXJ56250.1 flagellar M-ring protein FliF [Candidatus Marinarcus aquaticus]